MDQQQLAPVADILVRSYSDAATYSRWFIDEHGHPPTQAAKGHHLRAVAQARVIQGERYKLGGAFAESGRIEITDTISGTCYLLRSESTVAIERFKAQREALFDAARYLESDVVMLVHRFHADGLDLSVAGTRHVVGKSRLEVTGTPTFIGSWPYATADEFDQDAADPFGDVGEIGDEDEGGQSG